MTDPPDPFADVARGVAGRSRVLSTVTLLDTLRFRHHIGLAPEEESALAKSAQVLKKAQAAAA